MTAAELVQSLQARGVTLIADGENLRCRPASVLTPNDLAVLRARKVEVLHALRTSTPRRSSNLACYWCGRHRFWQSIHGVMVCGNCHPPATPELVAQWIDATPAPGVRT